MADDGDFRVGACFSGEGGWPSPNPKAVTEVFYVFEGHGCLEDTDGAKHYFGPGDTVIIPKGHSGRWDVLAPVHKVWAVNAHERIETRSSPIRVVVRHFHDMFAPHESDVDRARYNAVDIANSRQNLYGMEDAGETRTVYNVGPTRVGAWLCDEGGSFSIDLGGSLGGGGERIFFHLLEGILFLTDSTDGSARRCEPGDTVMLPAGFRGHIDVIAPVRKLWTTAAEPGRSFGIPSPPKPSFGVPSIR